MKTEEKVQSSFDKIYSELVEEAKSTNPNSTKVAYLLGAVDAMRIYNGFMVSEVEAYHIQLGYPGGELICLLQPKQPVV